MKKLNVRVTRSADTELLKSGFEIKSTRSHLWLAVTTMICLLEANTIVAQTNTAQLLSGRNASVSLPAGGDGDSIAPVITPDGRYVVFASVANDLTPSANDRFALNVYLRDRTAGTTALVSASMNGNGGGNDNSIPFQISTNGQFVLYQSDASDLVTNDTNGVTDIFMRDVAAGTTALVSAAPDGSPGSGASTDPIMTPDGRYVAFLSSATNLVAGTGTNGLPDLFVRDLILATNYLISTGVTNGGNVAITPDGRYVAFFSTATNLVPGIPATSKGEVYLMDRTLGIATWVSTNAAGLAWSYLGQTNVPSYHPRLSDDGQSIVFKIGGATAFPPTNGVALVAMYNVATATTTVISSNAMGTQVGLDDDYGPELTPDGEFVAYVQHEGNVNSNNCSVHVWDSNGGADTLVSDPGINGVITTTSMHPALSADGWYVAFLSNATNLVDDPVLGGFHLYLRNYLEGSLQLVDEDTNGIGSTDDQASLFSLSRFGRYVAFDSPDGSLANGDNNRAYDVFVRDLFSNSTEMDSQRNSSLAPQTGDALCESPVSVSTNGQWVAFASAADNVVANDTNNQPDVFVRDLVAGTTTLVSAGVNGGPALDGPSANPVISGEGRYVVFVSAATNLVAGQVVTTSANIFRRDLQTATTALVSLSTNGIDGANGDCANPAVSQDGRYVAFLSAAGNLAQGVSLPTTLGSYRTFLRDMTSGSMTALTNGTAAASQVPYAMFPPSMSADGRYVAYSSYAGPGYAPQLRVWDDQLGADVYTNGSSISNAVLSANGTRALYSKAPNLVLVDDLMTGTNIFTFNFPFMKWGPGGFSADGRYIAFVAQTNVASSMNVYLCDLQSQAMTLVCSNFTPLGNTVGSSDLPALSADGRFVVYRSYNVGLVPGDSSPAPNIYRYDSLLGTNSNLTAGQAGLSPLLWDSAPAVNGNGGTVAFLTLGSGLVSPDLNRAEDAFAYALDPGMPLDSDGDGIPDWWMIQFFGHPTGLASDNSLAQDDADGDGMSNLQEYLAGTNPTNPNSLLAVSIATDGSGTNLFLGWTAVSGKNYQVLSATNLSNPVWQAFPANITTNGTRRSFNVPAADSQRYFRVLCGN